MSLATGQPGRPESSLLSPGPTNDELNEFLVAAGENTAARETKRIPGVGCIDIRLDTPERTLSVLAFGAGRTSAAEYVAGLLEHLSGRGVPCPRFVRRGSRDGIPLGSGTGLLLALPSGAATESTSVAGCRALGALLGRLHVSALDYSGRREPPRGPRWWRERTQFMPRELPTEDRALLGEEVRFQGLYRFADLPRGAVHGGLDRDSVLFADGEPTGLAGFGEASTGVLLLDLAAAANTWCSTDQIHLEAGRLGALLEGYHGERPLRAIERGAWPVIVRAAALDGWLAAFERNSGEESAQRRAVLQDRIDSELMLQLQWV